VVIVSLVGLVAGLVVSVLVIKGSGSDGKSKPVEGQLRGTFPTKPTLGWQLDADAIMPGGRFVEPDQTSRQYKRAGFIDLGDTLITTVVPQQSGTTTLVAIDAKSGGIRWSQDNAGSSPVCARKTINGLLPCVSDTTVRFVRMSDGAIDHQLPAPNASRVEVRGSDVYTMGYAPSMNGLAISRGSVNDVAAKWRQEYPFGPMECFGSGDAAYAGVSETVVYFGSDAGVTMADVTDGLRVMQQEPQNLHVYPGLGFTGRICNDPQNIENVTTAVIDERGQVLRTHDSRFHAANPWLVTQSDDRRYLIERTAYDFSTGERLWTASGAPEVESLDLIIGDVAIGSGGYGKAPLAAFDIATGELLWSLPQGGQIALSDGQRVIMGSGEDRHDGLTSINLATGKQEWTMTGIDRYRVDVAGSGFAAAEKERITFYPATGGDSVAPGRLG
jgi:hypothetical protein